MGRLGPRSFGQVQGNKGKKLHRRIAARCRVAAARGCMPGTPVLCFGFGEQATPCRCAGLQDHRNEWRVTDAQSPSLAPTLALQVEAAAAAAGGGDRTAATKPSAGPRRGINCPRALAATSITGILLVPGWQASSPTPPRRCLQSLLILSESRRSPPSSSTNKLLHDKPRG
jgi:hypothetical protein